MNDFIVEVVEENPIYIEYVEEAITTEIVQEVVIVESVVEQGPPGPPGADGPQGPLGGIARYIGDLNYFPEDAQPNDWFRHIILLASYFRTETEWVLSCKDGEPGPPGSNAFADLTGEPTDNTALADALNDKEDAGTAAAAIGAHVQTEDPHPQYATDQTLADGLAAKISHSLATAINDFLVSSGPGQFVKKTLAEIKTILGLGSAAYTNSTDYAAASHTQAIPSVTGLQTALDGKAATSHKSSDLNHHRFTGCPKCQGECRCCCR